ncbi:MAG: ferrous iron transporter B [Alkalicoccus sp.]|uniref:Ferrous iron transporter B n=1 Tax=Alkalicoccus sp. TaxID=2005376 RepID=A0A651DHQ0_9BACI|nr:MAG: ferrous iron transporter B [Alkalicoccus sp.]
MMISPAVTTAVNVNKMEAADRSYKDVKTNHRQRFTPFLTMAVVLMIVLIYGLPVYTAYQFASFMEPLAETFVIEPLGELFSDTPVFIHTFLFGDFGIVSLGSFSFIWAFPVVVLVGMSIAITENTRLQNKLVFYIEPSLRKLGLSGADFIPVISGYGCNVVAVMQSKGCRSCTNQQCLSMISFGSACSYQIGATLSIFNAANIPWLFAPYIFLLFVVGAVHTRLWYGKGPAAPVHVPASTRLRKPDWKTILFKVKGMLSQFFYQAMPIFLIICFAAFLLDELAVIDYFISFVKPLLILMTLPPEGAVGVIFSFFRKDGILLFNEGSGAVLASFSTLEIFVLVYLASTLSGCLVTIWTIARQAGTAFASKHVLKQAVTSLVSAAVVLFLTKGVLTIFSYFN